MQIRCKPATDMTEKNQRLLQYFKDIPKHLGRLEYNDFCIDIDSYNCPFPSVVADMHEIERFEETMPRDKTIIYRARENESVDLSKSTIKLPFKSLPEISIIPDSKKHLVKFGRCNKPKEPRFYSSNDLRAACIESLTQGFTKDFSESKHVTVGRWKITEPLTLARINYSIESLNKFYQSDAEKYKHMLDFAYAFNKDTIKKISEHGHDAEFAEQILGLFADEFAKVDIENGHDYTISNYYCDTIFDRVSIGRETEKIDGILYPSVSFAYQEMNLVLHPRAMKKIKFLDASLIWVVHHAQHGQVQFIPLESNVKHDNDGNLQWTKFKW